MVSNGEIKKGLAVKRYRKDYLENQIICPKCGAKNRSTANFCRNCKNELNSTVNKLSDEKIEVKNGKDFLDLIICQNCGTENRNNANFCKNCKAKLSSTVTQLSCEEKEIKQKESSVVRSEEKNIQKGSVSNIGKNTSTLNHRKPWKELINNVKAKEDNEIIVKDKLNEVETVSNPLNSLQKNHIRGIKTFDKINSPSHADQIKTVNKLIKEIKSKENSDFSDKSKFKQDKTVLEAQSHVSSLGHINKIESSSQADLTIDNSLLDANLKKSSSFLEKSKTEQNKLVMEAQSHVSRCLNSISDVNVIKVQKNKNKVEPTFKINPIMKMNDSFKAATSFYDDGNYVDALKCLDDVLDINSRHSDALIMKSNCYYNQQNYFKALKWLNNIQIDYNNIDLVFMKADCYYNQKDYSKALECIDKILNIKPKHIKSLLLKATCCYGQEEYESALSCYNTVLNYVDTQSVNRLDPPLIKKSEIINKIEKTKKLLIKQKKNELISQGSYIYIEKFVIRYGNNPNKQKIDQLNALIKHKGFEINIEELESLISDYQDTKKYNEFKERIIFNDPQTLEEFVENFIDHYGENYYNYINFFENLLSENNISVNSNQIEEIIADLNKMKEIQRFEDELLEAEDRSSPYISIRDLDYLEGYHFELFLKKLFKTMGYKVKNTPLSGDQGADLVLERFNEVIAVQAKRYNSKVNNKAVQEVVASLAYYNANNGMVVTNSNFTSSAVRLARSNNVELINRKKLDDLLKRYPITQKSFPQILSDKKSKKEPKATP